MFGKYLGSGKNKRTQAQGPWWSQSKKLLILSLISTATIGISVAGYMSQITYKLWIYLKYLRLYFNSNKINPIKLHDILSLHGFWIFNDLSYPTLIYWAIFIAAGLTIVWYRIFRSYITYNTFEYGNESFENNRKVVKQYTNVPDRNKSFDGYGGIPVLHKNKMAGKMMQLFTYVIFPKAKKSIIPSKHIQDTIQKSFDKFKLLGKYMIDQATNNTLIYGITRSGKGETFVFPLIDILSRAAKKVSLFVNDPKGELARSSFFTLIKRGYKIVVIDLSNMYKSASYNPLQVIIDYAKKGYTDQVQMEVNKISTSIYQTKKAGSSDPFWASSSSNLLNALILAQIDLARRNNNDWSKVTLFNIYQMLTQMAGKEVMVDADEQIVNSPDDAVNKESMLTHYFNLMAKAPYDPFRQMALDAFSQSSFAGSETQGSIFSSMMEGIKIYQQQDVAKLTSKNSIDFKEAAFPRRFSVKLMDSLQLKTANVTFSDVSGNVIESRKQDIDNLGYLNYALKHKLPNKFKLTISVDNHKYIFNGQIVKKRKLIDGKNTLDNKNSFYDSDLLGSNLSSKLNDIGNSVGKKISQKIRVLKDDKLQFDESNSSDDKYSDVEFKYSEQPIAVFFVTPPNNDAYNQIVSFAIDQSFNQMYEMATQNDEQLSDKYDEKVANTIKANCSNTMYILSNDDKTTELISKKIGKTTVMTRNHSITPDLSVGRDTMNTNQTAQDVITPTELQHLMVGEQILLRANTRQSISGNKIRNNPIFAHGLTYEMPSRWQFLQNTFDTSTRMSDIPLNCLHAKMNLQDNAYIYFNNGKNNSDNNELDKMDKLAGVNSNDIVNDFVGKLGDKLGEVIDKKSLEADKKYENEPTETLFNENEKKLS